MSDMYNGVQKKIRDIVPNSSLNIQYAAHSLNLAINKLYKIPEITNFFNNSIYIYTIILFFQKFPIRAEVIETFL